MLVGRESSLGGEEGAGAPGSSEATARKVGWLNANEARMMSEIISEIIRKKFKGVGVFMIILLEEIPPY